MANHKKHIIARGDTSITGELDRRRVTKAVELEVMRGEVRRCIDEVTAMNAMSGNEADSADNLLAQADSLTTSLKDNQGRLLEARETAAKDCENFRHKHMLTRNPQTPAALLNILTSGCICLLETFGNAAFLSQAHMVATPTGALTTSFVISLSNVVMSSVGGFYIGRYKDFGENAINPDAPEFKRVRSRAKWQFKAFVAGMAGYTATIGLVRSQETLERVTHSLPAYFELITTPEALMLMGVSACISVFTYSKSKTAFSDEYPGFSKQHAAVEDANEALMDFEDDSRGKINDLFEEALEALKTEQKRQSKNHRKADKALTDCHASYRELEKRIAVDQSALHGECCQLINDFKGCGGKVDKDFDLEAHCSFVEIMDGLTLPESPSKSDIADTVRDIKAAHYMALERLNAAFKH